MLNKLLETCLQQFETLTKQHFEMIEPIETYHIIKTIYCESCPSILPASSTISLNE